MVHTRSLQAGQGASCKVRMAQLSAVRAAKQELRKALRPALASMTERQRREESEVLVRKVNVGRRCHSVQIESSHKMSPRDISILVNNLPPDNIH